MVTATHRESVIPNNFLSLANQQTTNKSKPTTRPPSSQDLGPPKGIQAMELIKLVFVFLYF